MNKAGSTRHDRSTTQRVYRREDGQTRHTGMHHSCGARGGSGGHRGTGSRLFHPGDAVPQSGIYEVIHDLEHRQAHDAVMIMGNQFPSCETCNENVRFRIVRTAPYIFQDQDFEDLP